jgi:hypothetical protein
VLVPWQAAVTSARAVPTSSIFDPRKRIRSSFGSSVR